MKAVLLIFVILLGVWLWRSSRPARPRQGQPKADDKPLPLDMVSCAFCSINLPATEGIKGNNGVYCCADHLAREEHHG